MEEVQTNDEQPREPEDRSHIRLGVILGIIIVVMTWLALYVDDPWRFFKKHDNPPVILGKGDAQLDNSSQMTDEDVRKSLTRFIEAFYFDQRRGYFDPPSYFAPITETFYNFHNLTYTRLKDLYWKRREDMQDVKYSWNPASLNFTRDSTGLLVTYWAKEEYFRPSRHSRQSADVHYELKIDGNGKIVSMKELEVSNFESSGYVGTVIDSIDTANVISSAPVQPTVPSNTELPPEADDQKIYEVGMVDAAPEFPGGQKELTKFVNKNLRYPEAARSARTEGKVFVGFIVEKNGSVSGVNVLRGIGSGCDEEAVRVIKTLPAWKPATIGGKPVRNAYVLSVNFKVSE